MPIGAARTGLTFNTADSGGAAIPDSGLEHHYDWSDGSTTTSFVKDQKGTADLNSGSFTDVSSTINGKQAGRFDGTDDLISNSSVNVSQPFELFAVVKWLTIPSDSNNDWATSSDGSNNRASLGIRGGISFEKWYMFAGKSKNVVGSSADTNPHLFTAIFDSASSKLRVDGSQDATGDGGGDGLDGISVGAFTGGIDYGNFLIGEIAVYDPSASGYSRSNVEGGFTDKWGSF